MKRDPSPTRSKLNSPLAVGVTGGIGSGKTEVCAVFASLGAHLCSADKLARTFLDTDPEIRRRVSAAFGARVYNSSGRIDRKELAKLVFADDALLGKLNAIVHPKVIGEIRRIIGQEKKQHKAPMIVVEAALMVEAGIEGLFDFMIVVEAGESARAERIAMRDGASQTEIVQRMRAQLPPEVTSERADFLIHNSGDLTALRSKCEFIFALLSRMQPPVPDDLS